jgi:hypothetical protein
MDYRDISLEEMVKLLFPSDSTEVRKFRSEGQGGMKIILEIPKREGIPARLIGRHRLRFTTKHPCSSYGLGVLLNKDSEVLSGFQFTVLRNTLGAPSLTTDVRRVVGALGLPFPSRGIELISKETS